MLTDAQQTILAADIRANSDQTVIDALAVGDTFELARLYNLDSAYTVWREDVTPAEYREGLVWTEIDGLTVGKARIWEWITQSMTQGFDATSANIRSGLNECFSGLTTATNLIPIAKELCTIAQELFAVGAGSDASPGVREVTGNISPNDIGSALISNP